MLLCLALAWTAAQADLLPRQAVELDQRFSRNPDAFDRTDPWCDGHGVNDRCVVPGNALEGGGRGQCLRSIDRPGYRYIDLKCALSPSPRIDRGLPDARWHAGEDLCKGRGGAARDAMREAQVQALGWTCAEPPVVSDRFCQGRAPGDACIADVVVGNDVEHAAGICKRTVESMSAYHQGPRTLTRTLVLCVSEHSPASSPLTPVGAWRKLFQ